jgi:hypothetical protein
MTATMAAPTMTPKQLEQKLKLLGGKRDRIIDTLAEVHKDIRDAQAQLDEAKKASTSNGT